MEALVKLYLASGYTLMSDRKKEEMLSERFGTWNRLMSYYFLDLWKDSILASKIGLPEIEKIEKPSREFFPERKKSNKQRISSKRKIDNCEICSLYKACKSPRMGINGKGLRRILLLGEGAGKEEDEKNEQFVGDTGKLLERKLSQYGIDMNRDCWKYNSVSCRASNEKGDNRKPTPKEISCCRSRVFETIHNLQPSYILLLGECAVESLYGERFSKERLAISIWRKRCIPDQELQAYILPLYHPAFLLHSRDNLSESVWNLDLKYAISCLKKEFTPYKEPAFLNLLDYRELVKELIYVKNNVDLLCYDYETTGLHPYAKNQEVVSISFAYDKNESFSFPLFHNDSLWSTGELESIIELWKSILADSNIRKVNHNIKFEESWNRHFFHIKDNGWISDTMVLAHLLDEMRGRSTTLELQSYFHLGIASYKNETEYYKKGKEDGTNRMKECPLDVLLPYGNRDVAYTFAIHENQQKELLRKRDIQQAYKVAFDGVLAFMDTEEYGLNVDVIHYKQEKKVLSSEIGRIEESLLLSSEAKEFYQHNNKTLDLASNKDLQCLFFDILKMPPVRKTKTGYSVDEKSLLELDCQFAKDLLRLRKLEKIRGTYLAQFLRNFDGKLYPSFDLHARTGRSTASEPNFQNIPIRDKNSNRICRSGIIPEEGYGLADFDYSGAEIRAMACLSKDQNLIDYILDKTKDMHRDVASDMFFLPLEKVGKEIRYIGKNSFVFAEFYGDYYVHAAQSAWEYVEEGLEVEPSLTLKKHLRNKGIKTYDDFERHMKSVEDKFWSRLGKTDNWRKETIVSYYRKYGYISAPFGHRRGGFLNRKQLMNTPVQNTAFLWLLWSYAQVNEIRKKEGWKSRLLGQIHDCIVLMYHPDERDHVFSTIIRIMTRDIKEKFDWIIVPLEIEIEMAEVNKSWYEKKEFHFE